MIEFGFNKEKANEVILYLSYRDEWMSKMRLLKFVFFADLYHINHYGRPILGDKYVAMKNGPVLSKLYDMLKQSTDDYEVINRKLIRPHRDANLDYLSKSDIEALNYALNQYSQYETLKLSDLSHEYQAWQIARNSEPNSNNPDMLWENMIEDREIIEELEENSNAIVF